MPPSRRMSTRSRTSDASSYDNPAPTTATTQAPPRRADRSGRAVRVSRALSSASTSTSRSTGGRRSTAPRRQSASESDIKQELEDQSANANAEGSGSGHRVNGVSGTKIRLRVGGDNSAPIASTSTSHAGPGMSVRPRRGRDINDDELSSELSEPESAEYGDLPAVLLPPRHGRTSTGNAPSVPEVDGTGGLGESSRANGRYLGSPTASTDSAGGSDYDPKSKGKSADKGQRKVRGKGKARADTDGLNNLSDTDRDDDGDVPLSATKRRRTSQAGGTKRKASNSMPEIVDLSSSQVLDAFAESQANNLEGRNPEAKADVIVVPTKRELPDPDDALAAYSCPICFGTLDNPVMTLCGHLLCAKCLLDALIAAIKRNPDPTPGPRGNQRGRGRSRGRGGRGGSAHSNFNPDHNNQRPITHPDAHPQGGPAEWTADMLKQAWYEHKVREINRVLPETPDPAANALRMQELDAAGRVVVQEQVKGLWMLEDGVYVVEGECPVCRKALPGGFGPPHTGIGGVIPLHVRAT